MSASGNHIHAVNRELKANCAKFISEIDLTQYPTTCTVSLNGEERRLP
jgi:hypothetical protein